MSEKIERPKAPALRTCRMIDEEGREQELRYYAWWETALYVESLNKRIAELKAENAELHEGLTLSYLKGKAEAAQRPITEADVRKAVKGLEWKSEGDTIWACDILENFGYIIEQNDTRFCAWVWVSGHFYGLGLSYDAKTLEDAKKIVEVWHINLIVAALGLGKDGK